jgi:hypothetical protein
MLSRLDNGWHASACRPLPSHGPQAQQPASFDSWSIDPRGARDWRLGSIEPLHELRERSIGLRQ